MTALTRFEPIDQALSLRDAVNQLLEESFVDPFSLFQRANVVPVDMYETEDALVVKASVPDFTADQLHISVEQNVLTIQGEKPDTTYEGLRPVRFETKLNKFARRLELPVQVESGQIQAELKDGILTITLPKAVSSRVHKIEIKTR